jgi:hypothetical protein
VNQLKKLLLGLTPMGAAAFVAGGGTFGSIGELVDWAKHPTLKPAADSSTKGDPIWRTKKALLLMMAVGLAAYLGFSGTFASFSAETSNNGGAIASGTLTMSDQVNTGTVCFSAAGLVNVNPNCAKVLNLSNVLPGGVNTTATVTLQNTGSLDAGKLFLYAPYVNSTLTAQVDPGAVPSLAIAPLEGTITAGDTIRVTAGGAFQDFSATNAVAGAATSIALTGATSTNTFPVGSTVTDISSNQTPTTTDCYDVKTPAGGLGNPNGGADLNFNPPAANPFCRAVLMWVQETGTNHHYCWVGNGVGTAVCTAPTTSALTSPLTVTPNTTSLAFAVNGNISANDHIHVVSGIHTQDFVATQNAYAGATSVPVTSVAANFAYPVNSVVTDTEAANAANIDVTNTISHFDTATRFSAEFRLYPVTSDGTIDQASTIDMAHCCAASSTRTFQVGLYLPSPNGANQNALQGLQSTFGMTWHIDQQQ